MTEREVLDLLRLRCSFTGGNGPRWAFIEHVRNAAGFDAGRTCDAMALDLWPCKGLELHGHEIKCSRSDWLAELRDPEKANAFRPYCERWWLVAADNTIVKPGELPPGWGLMVVTNGKVRGVKRGPRQAALPLPRTMLAAMFRAATKEPRA